MVARRQDFSMIQSVKPARIIEINEIDRLALMSEEQCGTTEVAKMLKVGEDTVLGLCKREERPLPHAIIAREYRFYKTLILWWLVNEQQF